MGIYSGLWLTYTRIRGEDRRYNQMDMINAKTTVNQRGSLSLQRRSLSTPANNTIDRTPPHQQFSTSRLILFESCSRTGNCKSTRTIDFQARIPSEGHLDRQPDLTRPGSSLYWSPNSTKEEYTVKQSDRIMFPVNGFPAVNC